MPKKRLKSIPQFQTEAEERQFWATHDTVDYIDWSKAKRAVFPNLRPSTETISLRLPAPLLADLKTLANERDVPYQSLLKVYLAEQVRQEQAAAGQHNPRLQLTGRKHGGRGASPGPKVSRARRTPRS
jgi:predicted DNA binding CopG/RHH family protein